MATFHINQRVKATRDSLKCRGSQVSAGTEGTVMDTNASTWFGGGPFYAVRFDGVRGRDEDDCWLCRSDHLAPLTPPAVDAWALEAVKRVTKPQPVDVPVKKHSLA